MSAGLAEDVTFRVAVDADALCIGGLATQVFLDTYATEGIRPSLARGVLKHLSTSSVSALLSNPNARFIVKPRLQGSSVQQRMPLRTSSTRIEFSPRLCMARPRPSSFVNRTHNRVPLLWLGYAEP